MAYPLDDKVRRQREKAAVKDFFEEMNRTDDEDARITLARRYPGVAWRNAKTWLAKFFPQREEEENEEDDDHAETPPQEDAQQQHQGLPRLTEARDKRARAAILRLQRQIARSGMKSVAPEVRVTPAPRQDGRQECEVTDTEDERKRRRRAWRPKRGPRDSRSPASCTTTLSSGPSDDSSDESSRYHHRKRSSRAAQTGVAAVIEADRKTFGEAVKAIRRYMADSHRPDPALKKRHDTTALLAAVGHPLHLVHYSTQAILQAVFSRKYKSSRKQHLLAGVGAAVSAHEPDGPERQAYLDAINELAGTPFNEGVRQKLLSAQIALAVRAALDNYGVPTTAPDYDGHKQTLVKLTVELARRQPLKVISPALVCAIARTQTGIPKFQAPVAQVVAKQPDPPRAPKRQPQNNARARAARQTGQQDFGVGQQGQQSPWAQFWQSMTGAPQAAEVRRAAEKFFTSPPIFAEMRRWLAEHHRETVRAASKAAALAERPKGQASE